MHRGRAMARRLRRFEPGRCYELSARTLGERYRFLPSAAVRSILLLAIRAALAVVADVGIVSLVAMGNHWHLTLRAGADPTGIPRFMQRLKSVVAVELNEHLGLRGTFWATRYSAIALVDDASVLSRLLYHTLNPVAAGLCARFEEWPGVSSAFELLGLGRRFDIPLELPPSWQSLSEEQLAEARAHLLAEVRARELAIADDRKQRGVPRPNVQATLKRLRHHDRPSQPKRAPAPLCFAATAMAKQVFGATWKAWLGAFRAASAAFREGALDVEFPAFAFPPRLARPPVEATA